MKKIYSMLMIAASLAMLWGCSSSDDDDNNGTNQGGSTQIHGVKVDNAPHWFFDAVTLPQGDIQGKPDWEEVNFFEFEDNMTAIVFVSEHFGVKLAADDRMAAIVDGEVREICEPNVYNLPDEEPLYCFMLYIPFEPDDDAVELQYYNAKANQTYITKNAFNVKDYTIGDDELFMFTLRPMTPYFFTVPSDLPFTPTSDDEVAMFIGDECCGVANSQVDVKGNLVWSVDAYDMNRTGEKAHVRYYSAQTKTIYMTEPIYEVRHFDINDVASVDTLKFK